MLRRFVLQLEMADEVTQGDGMRVVALRLLREGESWVLSWEGRHSLRDNQPWVAWWKMQPEVEAVEEAPQIRDRWQVWKDAHGEACSPKPRISCSVAHMRFEDHG